MGLAAMSEGHLTRDTLERLARNELTARELSEARRHVDGCEECAALADPSAPPAQWGLLAAGAALAIVLVLTLVAVQRC